MELSIKDIDKYIKILEYQRKSLVKDGNIIEAENLRNKLVDLRKTKVLKEQKTHINDKRTTIEESYNNSVEEIERKYDEKMEKVSTKANATEEKMLENHEKDRESFQTEFEKKYPKAVNNNKDIVGLKKVMDMLIRQKKLF